MTLLRPAGQADIPALKQLWHTVFGDSEELLSLFFSALFPVSSAFAAFCGKEAVGAAYVLPGFTLKAAGHAPRPCPSLYAVGVLPEHRGERLGEALTLRCRDHCLAASGALALVPASEELFVFYERHGGFRRVFRVCEGEAAAQARPGALLTPLSAEAYNTLREQRLAALPHLALDARTAAFWGSLCRLNGGGLFRLTLSGDEALAACEAEAGLLEVKELLCRPGEEARFAAALSALLARPRCRFRCPALPGAAGTARAFGMAVGLADVDGAYLGPAFD